ncbi:girdin isoform X2 [Nothobranchius furzeri]|uniref:girdin isoform X2 n=1 Tax=Nothobranchius furzeri TaxID=105023 RepID=UPI003904C06D
MEAGGFPASLQDQFMLSPLVTWVKTFIPNDGDVHLDFSDLLDGVILNDIMAQINPPSAPPGVKSVCRDPSRRIQNLNFLVQQVKAYYLDHLRQLIMIPLPDVLLLANAPYCEQSLDEMKKLLLLLLGCAVQCETKEAHIERIQTLDFETKAAIAAHIQELTHNQENVLDLQWLESNEMHPEEMESVLKNTAALLRVLLDQRDLHLETIAELMQEKEGVVTLHSSPPSPQSDSFSPSMQHQQAGTHLGVELADSRAKVRRLRQELEEKSEQMLDCRHELENMEAELKRVQQENSQLLLDARVARTYRDELDALREQAIKADKLESEVGRYREQLHKMDFYKAKVEELKEDNRVLQETKEVLEDQLEGCRTRMDKIHQLEKHSLLLKAQILDMEQEKEADTRRLKELQEENLSLCLAQRRSMEESQHLGWELEQLSRSTDTPHGQQSLSEEVSERTRSQILKLQKDNQSLLRTIKELRGKTQTKHGPHLVCNIDNFASSAGDSSVMQTISCPVSQNHNDVLHRNALPLETRNRESDCSQILATDLDAVLSTDGPGLPGQDGEHLHAEGSGEHFNDMILDLEVLENIHNRRHCLAGSNEQAPISNSSSPCCDSILTGAPARSSHSSKQMKRLEVKYRALDSVNQQLQTSLHNSERKVQRLEAEIQELEAENQVLQASLEELRISARRLEQLEAEKQHLEHEGTTLERDKRQLEKENRRLRQQVEIQEANLDSRNVSVASLEREMRSLMKELEASRETSERVKSLERDKRDLNKQAAIDQKALAALREELVCEKLKTLQRDNDQEKLTHELEMRLLNQESTQQDTADNRRFRMLESELESSLKSSLLIKDDKIAALGARLQESSSLNQQLRHELKTVKLSNEALQQRQQEEDEWTASHNNPPAETMTEWLRESQEATRELLRLKDRLIQNATLVAERQAMQMLLKQLESQSDGHQAQILTLQRQAASLQETNTALQTCNTNLQVEKSTLNSQSASLSAHNAQLQQQQAGMEAERDSAVQTRDELRGAHEQLLRDHERLAVLHERRAMEYEALVGKHACLKKAHRTLELEHRTLQDRYSSLLQQRTKLEELEKTLKEEQMRIVVEKEQHQTTAAECRRLGDEKEWLNQTYRQLLSDSEALTAEHKQLKSQLNEAKLERTWLEADFSKLKKEFQELDIASTKLTNQCELLSQLKGNLEEENRHLLGQIETLMLQNRTLLEQTMESKDLFHVEERQYIDKLNDLRRQKEKLEEKIMDQYKFYEPSPPRRRGNWIALKLKKLMKSGSREQETESTPFSAAEVQLSPHDSGSLVSSEGSAGDATSQPHSSAPLKRFPRLRARLKDRNKVKSLLRRSTSLSCLPRPSASVERDEVEDLLTSSLTSSILSFLHHPNTSTTTTLPSVTVADTVPDVSELWVTDKESNGSTVPSGCEDSDELQNHGLKGVQSRAQSQSSGEFSVSLENEPWSNGSSPVQQPQSRSSSFHHPPSDASTPQRPTNLQQQKEKASAVPTPSSQTLDARSVQRQKDPVLPQDFWLTRGTKTIRRGSRAKVARRSSDSVGVCKINSEFNGINGKDATPRASACSPVTVLYVQGKSSSMSGCLNCFSTPLVKEGPLKELRTPKSLPRASSVISTAEGSSRRSSVSSECRVTVKSEPLQISEESQSQKQDSSSKTSDPEPIPPLKPPRDPAVVILSQHHKSPVQESLLGSSFTFNSVFSNTIFSDSEVTTTTSRDVIHVGQNLSPLESQDPFGEKPQTLTGCESDAKQNTDQSSGLERKSRLLSAP